MASVHGFQESSMIALLTYGNTLPVQALLTSPEKIATAIAIFDRLKLADSPMIRVLLTHGGRYAIRVFLEAPQEVVRSFRQWTLSTGFKNRQ